MQYIDIYNYPILMNMLLMIYLFYAFRQHDNKQSEITDCFFTISN